MVVRTNEEGLSMIIDFIGFGDRFNKDGSPTNQSLDRRKETLGSPLNISNRISLSPLSPTPWAPPLSPIPLFQSSSKIEHFFFFGGGVGGGAKTSPSFLRRIDWSFSSFLLLLLDLTGTDHRLEKEKRLAPKFEIST